MKAGAALLAAVMFFGGTRLVLAGDTGSQAVATAQLKDGRVLHNVSIMETEGSYVILRCDEGLIKVAISDVPSALAGPLNVAPPPAADPSKPDNVMEWFDPNQAPATPPPAPGGKPAKPAKAAQASTQSGQADTGTVYRGCRLVSFQPEEFQGVLGCAEVVVQNETDQNVQIRPAMLVGVTESGARLPGRYFFAETLPPSLRRRELVPAHGQVTEVVTFTNDPLSLAAVRWVR